MATREAQIRVTVERGSFQAGIKGMERDTAASGKRMGRTLSAGMSAGLGNVKKSMAGLGRSLMGHVKTMATLGGAIGGLVMIKNAVALQHQYRTIAYNVQKVKGASYDWKRVQEMVNGAVDRTGAKAEDLANAFDTVFKATGKFDESASSLEAIGTMSTATGAQVESLANVAQMAVRKFGIASEALPEVLSEFESLTGVGGAALDDLGRRFGMMAGAAVDAGLEGRNGMKSLLTMLTMVDDKIGERAEPAIKRMFEVLREGGVEIKEVQKLMGKGFKFESGAGSMERLGLILTKGGKARSKLVEKLTGDAAIAFRELTKSFDTTMEKALAEGKPQQEAAAIALEQFETTISGADRKTRSYAENVEQARRNMEDDPQIKFQRALNKITEAMSQPKVLDAISKLADVLPGLAEGLAWLLETIIEHPILSAGVGVGGSLGGSFVTGSMEHIGGAVTKRLMGPNGPIAGAGKRMFKSLGSWFKNQNPLKELNTNAGALAGKFAGAAAAAYLLGKALEYAIDAAAEEYDIGNEMVSERKKLMGKDKVVDDLTIKREKISAAKTLSEKKKAREDYAEALRAKRQMLQKSIKGEGFATEVVSAATGVFGLEETSKGAKFKRIEQLDKQYEKQMDALGKLNRAMWDAAIDIEKAGGKAGSSRGPTKGTNKDKPGAEPAGRK